MCQEVCHQYEHWDSYHGVALHLVVDLCHGDGNTGITHRNGTDQNTGTAQHKGQFLAQHQTHDHQAEEQCNQNNFDVSIGGQSDHQIL